MKNMGTIIGISMAAAVLVCGCAKTTRDLDATESRDPLLRKALAEERAGETGKAILSLRRALDRNPGMALAHLRIALLYDEHAEDYARAIYHYNRYLELRPDTEKADMISDRINEAEVLFCASLSDHVASAKMDYRQIMQENERLKTELRQVRRNLAELSAAVATSRDDDKPLIITSSDVEDVTTFKRVEGDDRVYVVQQNDTLSRIAAKVYGDRNAWRRIYEANRDVLGSHPGVLEIGQELVIPE